jgi:hypothetical protein
MKLLSLDDFLHLFKMPNMTFTEFMNIATVKSGKNIYSLKSYMKDKNITKEEIKILYGHLQNKEEYLTRFYNTSMRIQSEHLHFNYVVPMKNKHINNNQFVYYKNLIRNIHFWDILQNTKSGIPNNETYLDMLFNLYKNYCIDYKILTPSAIHYMKEGRIGSVFSSFYFRASIMNPYLVYSLNKSILHGTRIFTPTLGWSSYCNGFLECSEVLEYVGTDVIPEVCKKTAEFAKIYSPQTKTEIFCTPSEKLLESKQFYNKYREHFDLVFFSPPYYRLELYKGQLQSTEKYKTYEEWLEKYWLKTMELCHHVLQKGGKMCYILSGYGSSNTGKEYDLISDMNTIAKQYFVLKNIQPMYNKDVHVLNNRETAEKIMIFTKK